MAGPGTIMNELFLLGFQSNALKLKDSLLNKFRNVEVIDTELLDGLIKETALCLVKKIEEDIDNSISVNADISNIKVKPVGEILVRTNVKSESINPHIITWKGRQYFRYMDYLYTPKLPDKMSVKEIIELCDIRLDYIDSIVDLRLNERVALDISRCLRFLTGEVFDTCKVLDFGCGSGISMDMIKKVFYN